MVCKSLPAATFVTRRREEVPGKQTRLAESGLCCFRSQHFSAEDLDGRAFFRAEVSAQSLTQFAFYSVLKRRRGSA